MYLFDNADVLVMNFLFAAQMCLQLGITTYHSLYMYSLDSNKYNTVQEILYCIYIVFVRIRKLKDTDVITAKQLLMMMMMMTMMMRGLIPLI